MTRKPEAARIDIYAKITDRIIADLERGARPCPSFNEVSISGILSERRRSSAT
jgi:antirestriction protein ArdC